MTAPSARELLNQHSYENWPKACVALAARVEKVLALHRHEAEYGDYCEHCSGETLAPWPCPTVRILNGEEA